MTFQTRGIIVLSVCCDVLEEIEADRGLMTFQSLNIMVY